MKSLVLYAILALGGGVTAAHHNKRHDGPRVKFSLQRETTPSEDDSSSTDPRRMLPRGACSGCWQHGGVLVLRGGGSSSGGSSSGLRDLTVRNVVLALRWTGEVNRQLEHSGVARKTSMAVVSSRGRVLEEKDDDEEAEALAQQRYDTLRGGARIGLAIEASHRIRSSAAGDAAAAPTTTNQPALTIYHTRSPRPSGGNHQQPRGAAAWGPDLELYLSHLVQAFGLSDDNDRGDSSVTSLALNLALVYLDRSSSVETPRSNGASPCPFVTPRTVHRLLLASLAVAAHVVTGRTVRELHASVGQTLGVPYDQFVDLVAHMLAALGDLKTFVTPQQLHHVQGLVPEEPSLEAIRRLARTQPAEATAAAASPLFPIPPPPPPRQPVEEEESAWPTHGQPRIPTVRAHAS